ncbi:hypothetical protein Spiaf_0495 [Spirochaeta africana DSM 8902]|uniref:Uncharacterized protein n=1 Tax=Spirochaeta africana (strain ATCC 700263 / DSM 8902 / Z-7692) TaxID=889378 RepID=H9UGF5_SPIAZ|nr:hypothetical protein Spiaf_0495 [Spirochaeta africana DSM 8902]
MRLRYTWRIFAGCAALFFGVVLLQQYSAAAVILCAVCGAAGLYSERWQFDTRRDRIRWFVGVAGIGRRVERPLSGLQDIRLLSIAPPRGGGHRDAPAEVARRSGDTRLADILSRRMVRLALYFVDGESLTVQADSIRRYAQLRELGEKLSDCTGARFREIEM